ncbi:MAG TPA: TIM-barrel domain-containing protein, partial [Aggregatilineales bacterium]|nr:TIM-barrel domain-containing protein [Aggregatilineales bacterium]
MANPLRRILSTIHTLRTIDRATALASAGYFFKKWRLDTRYGRHRAHGAAQTPGRIMTFEKEDRGLLVTCSRGALRLTVIAPDCIQVRFQASGRFPVPFSYAVAKVTWPAVSFSVAETDECLILSAPEMVCEIQRRTATLIFRDSRGRVISRDAQPITWREGEIRLTRELPADEACYGLAEQPVGLDVRGKRYPLWNTDPIGYVRDQIPVHFTIPFYLGVHKDYVFGLFWDNPARGYVDVGAERKDRLTFEGTVGELRYYAFAGADVNAVLGRYTELTGRMPMPPVWALGFHISRWSYYPADTVHEIATEFRRRKIPCDAIYFDIHYMDGYRCFTWDRERFPAPARLLGELADLGFKPMAILDPGIKVDSKYEVYQRGFSEDIFLK